MIVLARRLRPDRLAIAKWLMLLALMLMLLIASRQGWHWSLLVLLLVVPAIAIESNALRVASIGWAFEHGYTWSIKEPLAGGGIVFGGSDHRARTSHVEAESLAARPWPTA